VQLVYDYLLGKYMNWTCWIAN